MENKRRTETISGTYYWKCCGYGKKITTQDIVSFNAQYPNLKVKRTPAFHDRFLIIDKHYGYHIGASLKDAGKKCFGINKINDSGIIKDLIQRAELTSK